MTHAIELQGVTVSKDGVVILPDITVKLPAGRVIGILGPSGAGKTTLIRSLVGRQRIKSGTAHVLGRPVGSPGLRERIGYMTQSPAIYEDLTVLQNMRYFAAMRGAAQNTIEVLIGQVDLSHQKNQVVETLSGGQRSRLSLAIAMLGEPDLLVLDEPTVGVDPVLRRQLWNIFQRLAKNGKTLLISSHVMDEAEQCDELILLRDGRLLAHGTPKELCKQTHTKTVENAFLQFVEQGIKV